MEAKSISLHSTDIYDVSKYPKGSGIYNVHNLTNNSNEYYVVNKEHNLTCYIGPEYQWDGLFMQPPLSSSSLGPSHDDIYLLKLQILKLTNKIEDSQYKQLLAMLAASNETDKQMARDSITTLINTSV